jgi:prepilin-type N-terminal cleavage/methylation domain-containing protein
VKLQTILRGRKAGFTLMELLIALVIFAAVISLTYGAYNTTFKVVGNAGTNSQYGERARITLERFVDDLESLYLGKDGTFVGETATYGEFRRDSLRFTSRAHLVFNKNETARGSALIAYTTEEQDDGELVQLYRSDVALLPGVTAEEDKGFLLCDGLREVAFTYLDSDGNELETWSLDNGTGSGTRELPVMVKIRIGFADEETEDGTIYFSSAVAVAWSR